VEKEKMKKENKMAEQEIKINEKMKEGILLLVGRISRECDSLKKIDVRETEEEKMKKVMIDNLLVALVVSLAFAIK
jgi:hypothetical protein